MILNSQSKKTKHLLKKIKSTLLSKIFSYVPQKTSIQILKINKQLSSSLNLTIADYYLDKMYQEIILKSKGNLNNIFLQSFTVYKQSFNPKQIGSHAITFTKLISNMIKYMNYLLYLKKDFKTFIFSFDSNMYTNWMYFKFVIEVIRNIKYGLSIKLNHPINYKYYEIIKDAIHNLKEVNTVYLYNLKTMKFTEKFSKDYFDFCDWTKVKCLNFSESPSSIENYCPNKYVKDIYIPENAPFRKIMINDRSYFNARKLYDLISMHGSHIEHFKIYNFTDKYLYEKGETKLKNDFFEKMINLKKMKFIKCQHLFLYSFLTFLNKILPKIKVLTLDNILEYNSDNINFMTKNYNEMINNLKKISNLEKLEINFNPNLTELKVTVSFDKKDKSQDNKKLKGRIEKYFLEKFIKINLITKKEEISNKEQFKEFSNLIIGISSLKKLKTLKLSIPMDNRMSKIFNNYFNIGDSLNDLYIIHSSNLDLNQLFTFHPNLNKINFTLISDGGENPINKFKYEFGLRSWKSITLKDYPLNSTFIEALIKSKCSLNHLTLKDTVNISGKSDIEINNILLEIKNKIKF